MYIIIPLSFFGFQCSIFSKLWSFPVNNGHSSIKSTSVFIIFKLFPFMRSMLINTIAAIMWSRREMSAIQENFLIHNLVVFGIVTVWVRLINTDICHPNHCKPYSMYYVCKELFQNCCIHDMFILYPKSNTH